MLKKMIYKIFSQIGNFIENFIYYLIIVVSFPFSFLSKIYNQYFSFNARKLAKFKVYVKKINDLEESFKNLTDSQLKAKTSEFKERIAQGASIDSLMVEAFAVVKEASRRILGLVHYDEQLLGGIALHKGFMAEMKTGEGKTLVATLPSYLNALSGRPVHIVTVNDYLAKRDSDEMGQIHSFLGLTVGCILDTLSNDERKAVYACDIVYATNNQLGFDYLRDNMKYSVNEISMRGLGYAIIDEADSVLIDEARTPLIISGESDNDTNHYSQVSEIVSKLDEVDYEKDEKMRSVILKESGIEKIEKFFLGKGLINNDGLYQSENVELVHEINQSLKAYFLFKKNIDYIVKNGKILIIDEFTGRVLQGRRYSDGLHQALEAKEKVEIESENITNASITFQKFFALYEKIAGMSGTCVAESEEFHEIYKVYTLAIPTHKKMIRKDLDDEVYRTFEEKFEAILKEVKEAHSKGQPILLITGSVELSDVFASRFKIHGLKHQVLNARMHKEEAEIIADAGCYGAITIATNMAGRGTDIQLGGNLKIRLMRLKNLGLSDAEVQAKKTEVMNDIKENKRKVIAAGGLYVLGTERNESRRVDDQARGRSGRQGDPGQSKFFISLEDDLMRVFGPSDNLSTWLKRLGMEYGEAIVHPFITKAISKAQGQVEARNFDSRKNVFKYDQVLDQQRKMIYSYRNKFLYGQQIIDQMKNFVEYEAEKILNDSNASLEEISERIYNLFNLNLDFNVVSFDEGKKIIMQKFNELVEMSKNGLRMMLLTILDDLWKKHLHMLECLRQNVNLKAYAQKDPLNEYKKEGFVIFENLLEKFRIQSIINLFIFEKEMEKLNFKSNALKDILNKLYK